MPDRLCARDDNRYEQYSSVNKVNDAAPRASSARLAPVLSASGARLEPTETEWRPEAERRPLKAWSHLLSFVVLLTS